ncbi:MAG: marine proteobacterial sortase target protein [Nitrospirota bacterium]|nr:MAG: marine proteobacterial sortase target protein [Nitrospirota bacterium]
MFHHRNRTQLISAFTAILIWSPIFSLTHAEITRSVHTIEMHKVTRGSLLFRTNQSEQFLAAPTLHTNVKIDVTALIARGVVVQHFTNPSSEWVEGVYVFPLPETAAVDHLRIKIGERRIEGMILERVLAKKTYTAAKTQGRRASLLEQERPNMFTASVANIGPGETVSIEIEYQETLRFNQGRFSLRFPLVVGPRYIPGTPLSVSKISPLENGKGWARNTDQVPDASRITPWVRHPDQELVNPVNIHINLLVGFPLTRLMSPYHQIFTTHNQEGGYTVTLKNEEIPSDRDFELIWEPQIGQTPQAAVFTERKNDQTYFLIMVLPPRENLTDHLSQSREVILVIDTSGSMHGTSIEQAKAAVTQALKRLTKRDHVNIIQFNSRTEALFSTARVASPRTVLQATRYVAGLTADGGTEMLPALRKALQQEEETNRLRQVIFITDGQIGNESELFQTVQQQLRGSRLFTIGIGSAPNSYFMRKAAEVGGGTFTYIGKVTEVQEQMDKFFQKLEHPAMSNIQVQHSTPSIIDLVPGRVPDLYRGEPVMIGMKTARLPDEVTITGQLGQTTWETTLPLKEAKKREGIAVYWARKKIDSLMNQHVGNQHPETIRKKIIGLALQHHLVSRYTSLVAVDVTPVRSPAQLLRTHPMKTNLPYGQNYAAIFGLARGATPGPGYLLVGLLFLISAFGLYRIVKKTA